MRQGADFLKELRAEIAAIQSERDQLIRHKIAFVIGLFGIGSVKFSPHVNTVALLYMVPLVAIAFDMYIVGKEFRVRRAGAFFLKHFAKAPDNERDWEAFVRKPKNRDPFAPYAGALLSSIVLLASALTLATRWRSRVPRPQFSTDEWMVVLFVLWFVLCSAALVALTVCNTRLDRRFKG
jgi:hypothetical protein